MAEIEETAAPTAAPGAGIKTVFINCPYDAEYEPLFDALVFTVVSCGFWPRAAIESRDVSRARMDRIFNAIFSSDYSIHDLSRCQGEGDQMLARFNMPLELGIAMCWRAVNIDKSPHDWLVLVPENASYSRFVSDLMGYDIPTYDGKPETLIRRVMGWLSTRPGTLPEVRPTPVIVKLEDFRKDKIELQVEWGDVPWRKLVEAAARHAPTFK
jgi:hypothetical protein